MALVVESSELSGGYILGFRIDPLEKLQEIQREIASLHKLYSTTPIFGVEYDTKDELPKTEEVIQFDTTMDDINEIDDTNYESHDAFAAYLADGSGPRPDSEIVFCRELGVAMEKIKDGFTLESLWSVLPPEPNKKALLELNTSKPLFLTSNSMSYFCDSHVYMRSKYSLQICFN